MLLLGASGSGKSTLLRGIAGLLASDEGEAEGTLEAPARGAAGLVLQDPDSQVILSRVGDDVAFGCENLGIPRDEIWPRVRWALDAVGLETPLDRSTADLSGGQRQRLAIAGALAMRPHVLLLDEPTANLDPAGVAEVRDAVAAVLELTGATLVVVEHRVATWLPLVDRVVVLGPEGVIADGGPDEVLEQRGAELAARGIWVPSVPPPVPARRRTPGAEVLSTSGLVVGRDAPVQSVDVALREGEILAFTGPNGVGKSTLGLTLGGLLPPLEGTVTALGRADPHRWKARELLGRIGSVFQDPEHQFLTATVRDEVEFGPKALRQRVDVDALLERLDLAKLSRANPYTLSGGEQRRLSVATTLATPPRILILDEPTFGQDSVTWAELVAIIAELADDGIGVVASTHDPPFVESVADRVLELR